jgi:hypothetical protein
MRSLDTSPSGTDRRLSAPGENQIASSRSDIIDFGAVYRSAKRQAKELRLPPNWCPLVVRVRIPTGEELSGRLPKTAVVRQGFDIAHPEQQGAFTLLLPGTRLSFSVDSCHGPRKANASTDDKTRRPGSSPRRPSVSSSQPLSVYRAQTQLFYDVGSRVLARLFNYQDSVVMATGLRNSGKSFSMTGRNLYSTKQMINFDQQGLFPRFLEALLASRDLSAEETGMKKRRIVKIEVLILQVDAQGRVTNLLASDSCNEDEDQEEMQQNDDDDDNDDENNPGSLGQVIKDEPFPTIHEVDSSESDSSSGGDSDSGSSGSSEEDDDDDSSSDNNQTDSAEDVISRSEKVDAPSYFELFSGTGESSVDGDGETFERKCLQDGWWTTVASTGQLSAVMKDCLRVRAQLCPSLEARGCTHANGTAVHIIQSVRVIQTTLDSAAKNHSSHISRRNSSTDAEFEAKFKVTHASFVDLAWSALPPQARMSDQQAEAALGSLEAIRSSLCLLAGHARNPDSGIDENPMNDVAQSDENSSASTRRGQQQRRTSVNSSASSISPSRPAHRRRGQSNPDQRQAVQQQQQQQQSPGDLLVAATETALAKCLRPYADARPIVLFCCGPADTDATSTLTCIRSVKRTIGIVKQWERKAHVPDGRSKQPQVSEHR